MWILYTTDRKLSCVRTMRIRRNEWQNRRISHEFANYSDGGGMRSPELLLAVIKHSNHSYESRSVRERERAKKREKTKTSGTNYTTTVYSLVDDINSFQTKWTCFECIWSLSILHATNSITRFSIICAHKCCKSVTQNQNQTSEKLNKFPILNERVVIQSA